MQCLFLFRDAAGRLPTAQELRRCGFRVSGAVQPAQDSAPAPTVLAAETPATDGPAAALGRFHAPPPAPAEGEAPDRAG